MLSSRGPRVLATCAAAVATCRLATAEAQEPAPSTRAHEYSAYEKASIRDAVAHLRTQVDQNPEGKVVEEIDVVSLDVIEQRDPAPNFLNIFHAKTRPYVIRREVLMKPGDRYSQGLCDESARNLREFHQLSLVACIAERGSRPDRVRILVVAKDVWSLRLNSDFRWVGGGLEYLVLAPSEENLFGTHHTTSLLFSLYPLTYSVGARYGIPRVAGSRVRASAEGSIVLNRESGSPGGSFGLISVGQPLYSTRAQWAWTVPFTWDNEISRRYVNGALSTFNSRLTTDNDHVPYEYRARTGSLIPAVTRSFGWALKQDLQAGIEVSRREYELPFDRSLYDPVAVQDFQTRKVPVSDNRAGPFLQYRTYRTDYVRVLNLETLGLQEDFRLGHDFYLRLFPSVRALSSTRNVMAAYAGAQYTWALRDGIVRLGVESTTEFQVGREADSDAGLTDGAVRASGRMVTPSLGFGRIVIDALVHNRFQNYLNRRTYLGGDTRLRGYPTRYFDGKDMVSYNMEFRSRPVEVLSCQIAGTLFYDVGDTFDGFSDMALKTSLGFGVRAMFPQLDRAVLRADVGFPMTPVAGVNRYAPQILASFYQAFPMPAVSPR
jgi:hypothetical protein